MTEDVRLHDAEPTFIDTVDGLTVRKDQEITPEFLDQCADARFESAHSRAGDFHQVASIPTIVVEKWLREGFDVFNAPARETLARLRREGLDAFITTAKRI